jgi:site-specific DNA recombinase
VIEEEAAAVRRAFDAFLGEPSLSIRRIREDLNNAGHLTARGSEFSVDAVRYLLANSLYAGFIRHYKTGELYPVQGEAFPPIVGEQTWRAAVAKLEDNVRRSARQGNQPKYLLSTIGLCGKCGATLVSGTNSRKQPTYRCGEQFHLTRQREPVDAMVTEAVLTRLSSVDVHDLVMPQEDDGPDREELLTERNALVERVKELSPLLRDIHQPVLEITAAINDVKARIDEIDAELLDRSVSVAAKLLADVEEPVGTAERREVVEAKWKALDVDRRRMLVDELVTVTIEPIMPGHVKFDPDLDSDRAATRLTHDSTRHCTGESSHGRMVADKKIPPGPRLRSAGFCSRMSSRSNSPITVAGNRKILMSEDFRCLSLSTSPAHPRSTTLASIRAPLLRRRQTATIPSSPPPVPLAAEPVSAWHSLR